MTRLSLMLATALSLTASTLTAAPAIAGEVSVTLTEVRADAGPIYVGLQTEAQFMKNEGVAGAVIQAPTTGTDTVVIRDVPAGRYAVGVWQDTDRDGAFSMGADGRPADGWSIIGGADLRQRPTFAGSSVAVGGEPAAVELTMLYPR